MGSIQNVDVEARRSIGDDASVGREELSAMGINSTQQCSLDDDNFDPFWDPSPAQQFTPSQPDAATQASRDKAPMLTPTGDDEATSPDKRQRTPAYDASRKKKGKKSSDHLSLSEYCILNKERINMARSLFQASVSAPAAQQETYTMRQCVQRLKSLPGYTRELLIASSTLFVDPEKRAWFMSIDDEDAIPWIEAKSL